MAGLCCERTLRDEDRSLDEVMSRSLTWVRNLGLGQQSLDHRQHTGIAGSRCRTSAKGTHAFCWSTPIWESGCAAEPARLAAGGRQTARLAARRHGDWLVVGVLSDDTAASYKRRPIMSLAERVAVIEACRYVDEVIQGSPFQLTEEFLVEHDIATVVHGDDLSLRDAEIIYGPAVVAGKFRYAPRSAEISTTQVIQRVLVATGRQEAPARSSSTTSAEGRTSPNVR